MSHIARHITIKRCSHVLMSKISAHNMTKHITTPQYDDPLTNHMPKHNMPSQIICPNTICYNQIIIFSFRVVRLPYGQTYSHYSHNIPNYPNIYFYFNPTAQSQFIMLLLLQFDFTNGTLFWCVPIPVVTFPIQISLLFLISIVAYLLVAYAATVTAVHMLYVTVSANSLHTLALGLERIIAMPHHEFTSPIISYQRLPLPFAVLNTLSFPLIPSATFLTLCLLLMMFKYSLARAR